jgi:hypothetical protein
MIPHVSKGPLALKLGLIYSDVATRIYRLAPRTQSPAQNNIPAKKVGLELGSRSWWRIPILKVTASFPTIPETFQLLGSPGTLSREAGMFIQHPVT